MLFGYVVKFMITFSVEQQRIGKGVVVACICLEELRTNMTSFSQDGWFWAEV